MRTLTQPPPSLHCKLCGGELRLKLVKPTDPQFDLETEIFVCANCGREQPVTVMHDPYVAHSKASQPDDHVRGSATVW